MVSVPLNEPSAVVAGVVESVDFLSSPQLTSANATTGMSNARLFIDVSALCSHLRTVLNAYRILFCRKLGDNFGAESVDHGQPVDGDTQCSAQRVVAHTADGFDADAFERP
jgi:hypothetical protein